MASSEADAESLSGGLPGLLDLATLARMASAKFAEEMQGFTSLVQGGGITPASSLADAGRAAGDKSTSDPLAAQARIAAPRAFPSPASPADLPARPADLPLPSTPYYFIEEASARAVPSTRAAGSLGTVAPSQKSLLPLPAHNAPGQDAHYYFVHNASPPSIAAARPGLDLDSVRSDFPILSERVNGHQLVWLDNAATTQKPRAVIDRLVWYYLHENSNVHRAAHELAARATDALETARSKVARFLGASSPDEIIFVRGATEAINLVAQSWGRHNVAAGDELVISHLEHHANIVPWQQLAAEKDAKLRVIPVDDEGQIRLDAYRELLNDRTRIVSIAHVSNAIGTVVPIREVIEMAHAAGARVLVDGAQAVAHTRLDVTALDTDFYVFSGHKVFGPTGIGVVYGKADVLEAMPPWQGGGSMIRDVTLERAIFQDPPARFEAGTGNIADAIGLGTALDYLEQLGIENVARHEHDLLGYATRQLLTIPGLRLVGTAPAKASVLSFLLAGYRPDEVGPALNQQGIAVRAGHHCAQPILRRYGIEATVRASLALYNTYDEIDQLVATLQRLAADRRAR